LSVILPDGSKTGLGAETCLAQTRGESAVALGPWQGLIAAKC